MIYDVGNSCERECGWETARVAGLFGRPESVTNSARRIRSQAKSALPVHCSEDRKSRDHSFDH